MDFNSNYTNYKNEDFQKLNYNKELLQEQDKKINLHPNTLIGHGNLGALELKIGLLKSTLKIFSNSFLHLTDEETSENKRFLEKQLTRINSDRSYVADQLNRGVSGTGFSAWLGTKLSPDQRAEYEKIQQKLNNLQEGVEKIISVLNGNDIFKSQFNTSIANFASEYKKETDELRKEAAEAKKERDVLKSTVKELAAQFESERIMGMAQPPVDIRASAEINDEESGITIIEQPLDNVAINSNAPPPPPPPGMPIPPPPPGLGGAPAIKLPPPKKFENEPDEPSKDLKDAKYINAHSDKKNEFKETILKYINGYTSDSGKEVKGLRSVLVDMQKIIDDGANLKEQLKLAQIEVDRITPLVTDLTNAEKILSNNEPKVVLMLKAGENDIPIPFYDNETFDKLNATLKKLGKPKILDTYKKENALESVEKRLSKEIKKKEEAEKNLKDISEKYNALVNSKNGDIDFNDFTTMHEAKRLQLVNWEFVLRRKYDNENRQDRVQEIHAESVNIVEEIEEIEQLDEYAKFLEENPELNVISNLPPAFYALAQKKAKDFHCRMKA